MHIWGIATRELLCGGCPNRIAIGEPVRWIQLPNVTRQMPRCQACAGAAPPSLPAAPEPQGRTKRMTPIANVALPFQKPARGKTS